MSVNPSKRLEGGEAKADPLSVSSEGLFYVKNAKEHETRVRIRKSVLSPCFRLRILEILTLHFAPSPPNLSINSVNTGVIIHSHFLVRNKVPVESGSFRLDGVGTPGSPIRLDFQKPGGSMTGKLLPTGNPTDVLNLPPSSPGGLSRTVRVSCVDAGNPVVFVQAEDLGFKGNENNQVLLAITPELLQIRALASVKMGLSSTVEEAVRSEGVPKVAIVGSPRSYVTPSGRVVRKEEIAIVIRAWSMGLPHPAFQMTGAVCLASACSIPGTLPYDIVHSSMGTQSTLKLGHASGTMDVDSELRMTDEGVQIASASVYRTARRLMEGTVLI